MEFKENLKMLAGYMIKIPWYNFRLTDFQSALANNQINRIKKILRKL